MQLPRCRFCSQPLTHDVVDLGLTPLANSYLTEDQLARSLDTPYPLRVRICDACFLVQADAPVSPEAIFSDYAYFSSYSDSWVEHARRYAAETTTRFGLNKNSMVIEVASNDGYLLQHFVNSGIPALGIEPAANVAAAAQRKNVPTEVAFFGVQTAKRLREREIRADLMIANNVLAHVPDIADFLSGFELLLKADGVATFEFPHLLRLINDLQFDTIYHEHFYYLSLLAVERILHSVGLRAFDVQELPTHGGSLRLYVCHADAVRDESQALTELRIKEHDFGLDDLAQYQHFSKKIMGIKTAFLNFVADARKDGKKIAGYGAAAKGNTFLNVCGVSKSDIVCVFDRNETKQHRFLPGSHIPVCPPESVTNVKPDYLLILPWNLRDEIVRQMAIIGEWNGRFVTAIPELRIFES